MQNEAVYQILKNQDGWKITHIPISAYRNGESPLNDQSFDITLVDVFSLSENPETDLEDILSWPMVNNVVLMHNGQPEDVLNNLLKVGAKKSLSINNDTDSFIDTLSKFK